MAYKEKRGGAHQARERRGAESRQGRGAASRRDALSGREQREAFAARERRDSFAAREQKKSAGGERRDSFAARERRSALEEREGRQPASGAAAQESIEPAEGEVILEGTFLANARGFGFVRVEGESDDVFIHGSHVNGAWNSDEVQIAVTRGAYEGRRREGRVLKVLRRGTIRAVCTFQKKGGAGIAAPDNPRLPGGILIPQGRTLGARSGQKVVVEIDDYGKGGKGAKGSVSEILGYSSEAGTDVLSIIRAYDLPDEFPPEVEAQASRVAKPVSEADMRGRLDLREWQTVTIDGADAKDLDDAVTITEEGGKFVLGVHIADVANYVQERSALDREALARGTSVYLVDRVIPMLPTELSNGICSLNQGEDRLALSCIMTVDGDGEVVDHVVAETVIRVDRRMTYDSVNKILEDRDEGEMEKYAPFVPMFERMERLSAILRKMRHKRGSIDFEFPEAKIILDGAGRPVEIVARERNTATKIIEDFMLLANETVAQDYHWRDVPFVYRTHEKPEMEKARALSALVASFGYTFRVSQNEIRPKDLQKLLERVAGTPEEGLIGRIALRSMRQARYDTENLGHFGLASPCYCHFTSPIRRYPDLQVHRIIKDCARGRMGDERIAHYEKILPEVAKHSSETERRAEEAERETDKLKKAQYMAGHIGEEFDGVISGVNEWGFYVELPNTVEGLVHVSTLTDDYYDFIEDSYELRGESAGRIYKLGQEVRVVVTGVDDKLHAVDFADARLFNDGVLRR